MVTYYTADEITSLLGKHKAQATTLHKALLKIQMKAKRAIEGKPTKEGGRAPTQVLRYEEDQKKWDLVVKYGNKVLWGVGSEAANENEAKHLAHAYLDSLTPEHLTESQIKTIEAAMREYKKRGDVAAGKRKGK